MPEDALQLSATQSFEKERMARLIRNCESVPELQRIAEQLLSAWMMQRAAALWAIKHANGQPSRDRDAWIHDAAAKFPPPDAQ